MDDLFRDIRFSLRQIRRRPRISLLVVLCAALAIGLNASVFTLVDAVTLQEPAIDEPERMVRLVSTFPGFDFASFSYPNFRDLKELDAASDSPVFENLAVYAVRGTNISIGGENERLTAVLVSGEYFRTLGVEAARGRVLSASDDTTRSGHPVAVISDRLWRSRFGSDPDVVGRSLLVNSEPFTVVGVTPPEWTGNFPGMSLDLYLPLQMQPLLQPSAPHVLDSRGYGWLTTLARLSNGVEITQARARMTAAATTLKETHADANEEWGIGVYPGISPVSPSMQETMEMSSFAMLGLVGAVLLIACANIAGLLLARAEERQKEIGVRLAIGAGRGRLVRQMLVESVTLASVGGLLGTWIAHGASAFFSANAPWIGNMPIVMDLEPDPRVYLFSVGLTLLTGLLFGLLPALQATRPDLVPVLKGDSRGAARGRFPMRQALVCFQVAVSMMLLITAGLFLRSLTNEQDVELGFDQDRQLIASIDPSLHGYDDATGPLFFDQLRSRLEALPGVESVAYAEMAPLTLFRNQQSGIEVEGYTPGENERMSLEYNIVSDDYFKTLGTPMLQGRGFERRDNADGQPVIVINRALAERFWTDGQAVGKRIQAAGAWREVIGIVPDTKYRSRRAAPEPLYYLPMGQVYEPSVQVHLRTAGAPESVVGDLRNVTRELDPTVTLFNMRTMENHLSASLMPARTGAQLVGLFGLFALLLAAVGLFGLLSHAVALRTKEIGIRMSIGASAQDIFRHMLSGGLRLVAIGLVLGCGAGLAAGQFLTRILYQVSGAEPTVLLPVTLVLLATACVAVALPARRATRIEPVQALRQD